MADIPKNYDAQELSKKWYEHWQDQGLFRSVPDERTPYTVVIPPPNVTGVLHMGHILNNTIQDVLVRKARMEGRNTCWVPGTDHASIATEAKVVEKLQADGVDKRTITREEFLEHAWQWTEEHGGTILEQLKMLGASCDWDRTTFTMDDAYYESVIKVFRDLYDKGYIYRDVRMVNWDPEALTALSDEEVVHKEVNSKLYHIKYDIEGSEDQLTIATTRPETILGDTAVSVHPEDERYKHLVGKKALIPLIGRKVPIIADAYVDPEFGTGCLKVTPAHDENDHRIGQRHGLEVIDILNNDGTLNEKATIFVGEDRDRARSSVANELRKEGRLIQEEDIINKVGYSERTDVVIEPKLSLQWFLRMKDLSKPALENVMNGNIRFFPGKFRNSYRHWMENIKDWCISRQLWWGHRIPAYYYGPGAEEFVVAESRDEALEKAREKSGNKALKEEELKQDEDVLDTWFSSWIWPIAVFDGIRKPDNPEVNYYYPTNDLVTAPEILFFWVARMIISGYHYRGERPFENVYFTGIVKDKLGRKMSKSLGNSPDPMDLMEEYSPDGVRVGMLLCSPMGNDLLFDTALCEQGRNFANKMWNALRLIKSWKAEEKPQPDECRLASRWYEARLNQAIEEYEDQFEDFRISSTLMTGYRLMWEDFCSWYLEAIKPGRGETIDAATHEAAIDFFEKTLKLIHPFLPFITEELWHLTRDRTESDCIMVASWPQAEKYDGELLKQFEFARETVTNVRKSRQDHEIGNKQALEMMVRNHEGIQGTFDPVIKKLANLSSLVYTDEKVEGAISFMVGRNEYFLPGGEAVDVEEEKQKLKEELEYVKGFLASVEKKLSNEGFIKHAPEQVVEKERKKEADARAKIKVLEEKLEEMEKN